MDTAISVAVALVHTGTSTAQFAEGEFMRCTTAILVAMLHSGHLPIDAPTKVKYALLAVARQGKVISNLVVIRGYSGQHS